MIIKLTKTQYEDVSMTDYHCHVVFATYKKATNKETIFVYVLQTAFT